MFKEILRYDREIVENMDINDLEKIYHPVIREDDLHKYIKQCIFGYISFSINKTPCWNYVMMDNEWIIHSLNFFMDLIENINDFLNHRYNEKYLNNYNPLKQTNEFNFLDTTKDYYKYKRGSFIVFYYNDWKITDITNGGDYDIMKESLELLMNWIIQPLLDRKKVDEFHKQIYLRIHALFYYDTFSRSRKSIKSDKVEVKRKKIKGFIYCIESQWFYKLWRTKNIDNRYSKYITENPNEVILIHSYLVEDTVKEEKIIHNKFKYKRHRWEWFNLTEGDLLYIKNLSNDTL